MVGYKRTRHILSISKLWGVSRLYIVSWPGVARYSRFWELEGEEQCPKMVVGLATPTVESSPLLRGVS